MSSPSRLTAGGLELPDGSEDFKAAQAAIDRLYELPVVKLLFPIKGSRPGVRRHSSGAPVPIATLGRRRSRRSRPKNETCSAAWSECRSSSQRSTAAARASQPPPKLLQRRQPQLLGPRPCPQHSRR